MSKPRDGVTVVLPAHNSAATLDKALPAWVSVLSGLNRPFEIIVVNDGSTDGTAELLQKRAANIPHLHVLTHNTRRGFGACIRTALAEARQPLLHYAGLDYPYTPNDIRAMLERIELRDDIFGKQPDLISGARTGQPRPFVMKLLGGAWKLFWRIFAGLPMRDTAPWYGWSAWCNRLTASWLFGVPLVDVYSAFKLWRVSFLKRFPIQSDGDFVHVELVAKATFLTSIMDEVPLTSRPHPFPVLGPIGSDRRKVLRTPEFAFHAEAPPSPPVPEAIPAAASTGSAGELNSPGTPVPTM